MAYNNNEERTTHTVSSSSNWFNVLWQSHKVNRHLAGVAVVFLAGFAFWEVSFTIIVIVHFLIWKVIRIRTTSLSEDGTHPPCRECHSRACLRDGPPMARLRKMRGTFLCHWQRCPAFPPACLYERSSLSPVGDLYFTGIPVFRQGLCCIFNAARLCLSARENFACPRGKMAGLQIAVFPVNAAPIPVGALHEAPGGKEYISLQIVGESAGNVANSPTITAKTINALHGRFVKRPYGRNGLFSQPLLFFTGIPVFRQGLCCIFNAARLCLSARNL